MSDWALSLDEVQRLELYVEPWNEGSWHAAEKCGFQCEGLLRSWQLVGGGRKDMYMYSRIRSRRQTPAANPTKPMAPNSHAHTGWHYE